MFHAAVPSLYTMLEVSAYKQVELISSVHSTYISL